MSKLYKSSVDSREELCEELVKLKDNANVKLKEALPVIRKLTSKKIADIENPEVDCKVSDVLLYLQMCGEYMTISLYDDDYVDDMVQLRKFFKEARKDAELSIVDIAKKSRVSSTVIERFIYNNGNLKVSDFFKITNALGIVVEIG